MILYYTFRAATNLVISITGTAMATLSAAGIVAGFTEGAGAAVSTIFTGGLGSPVAVPIVAVIVSQVAIGSAGLTIYVTMISNTGKE